MRFEIFILLICCFLIRMWYTITIFNSEFRNLAELGGILSLLKVSLSVVSVRKLDEVAPSKNSG